jgi:hypothetical protein
VEEPPLRAKRRKLEWRRRGSSHSFSEPSSRLRIRG